MTLYEITISTILFVLYWSPEAQARSEGFTDTNNNLQVSLEAPDDWNSGMISATIHNLGKWRSYGAAATNDDLSAFFVIINLPSLANLETLSFNPSLTLNLSL